MILLKYVQHVKMDVINLLMEKHVCVENCLTATDQTEKCKTCKPGCYKSTNGKACTCIENCITIKQKNVKM